MRIGVFDSGVGGLTVLAALQRSMPQHSFLYLGDTARVPYGTRSAETVTRYALTVAQCLIERGAQALIVACNTATTYALPQLIDVCAPLNIPVFGVIKPGVADALSQHKSGTIAVLGTTGTINGGAYERALKALSPTTTIVSVACPLFVPLAEEGITNDPITQLVAQRYLLPIKDQVTTVILGCTHYPLLHCAISQVLPNAILIDSAQATARVVSRSLANADPEPSPSTQFFVTDDPSKFRTVGAHFLGTEPLHTQWIDLRLLTPPFMSTGS